jgi:hypothetical protein
MRTPVSSSTCHRLGRRIAVLLAVVLVVGPLTMPTIAGAAEVSGRSEVRILSASWGTDGAVGCPSGEQGLDNVPVTFSWFISRPSIDTTDFEIVRSDGTTATPTCALQFPPDEPDEAQTVNLIGDFGDAAEGPTPVAIRVVGALEGAPPGATPWRPLPPLPEVVVDPLAGGPYIVDLWTLTPALYEGDRNRCTVGEEFLRVMWSNGLTAYPTGDEVGPAVVDSYRAIYELPGGDRVEVAPLDVADLHDHPSAANADNMHDLCLPPPAECAVPVGVAIAGGLIQDPNGDPNDPQRFSSFDPPAPPCDPPVPSSTTVTSTTSAPSGGSAVTPRFTG